MTSRSRRGRGAGYKTRVKITRFKFDDHGADWHLEETAFDQLNLLVGVSGVGKTKILEALRRVCGMGSGKSPGKIEWLIEFEHDERFYQWEGMTGTKPSAKILESISGEEEIVFVREKLTPLGEVPVITRDEHGIQFRDQVMPPLAEMGSALHILQAEKELQGIRFGFAQVIFSTATNLATVFFDPELNGPEELKTIPLDHLRLAFLINATPLLLGVYVMQELHFSQFEEMRDEFTDIFDSVQDMRIQLVPLSGIKDKFALQFAIQERGSSRWVRQSEMSSGMLRTLAHIFEMAMAPPGSVIVIDEFENSLGVNCMSDLAGLISRRTDCQVILTSHHPYIINRIPVDAWKLVTRKGGHVQVTNARDIPEMQSASRLEAFTRLINLPQFEKGIQ